MTLILILGINENTIQIYNDKNIKYSCQNLNIIVEAN